MGQVAYTMISSKKSAEVIVNVFNTRHAKDRTFQFKESVLFDLEVGTSQTISQRSHAASRGHGRESVASEVVQPILAENKRRALPETLMEEICSQGNLNQAYLKVKRNKGAAGIDGQTIELSLKYLKANKDKLIASLQEGSYQPQAVRGVEIPKSNGGKRQLGIPTVVDRVIQQAILQILQPYFEGIFSESSHGFRPKRSAHSALSQAQKYVEEGNTFVVDVDLEAFFDRVNHDILMSRLALHIKDKRLLRVIRAYLTAGIMNNGVVMERQEGTPQGGPLSPLLSNILLTDLDRELEKRGHKFARYADDCNIYVRSEAAAQRVLASVTRWLEQTLKLKVNTKKSAAARVNERKFLGYTIQRDGHLSLAQQSVERFKSKIRALTKRRTPMPLMKMIDRLKPLLIGWRNYFKLVKGTKQFEDLDGWIRRRLRCMRLQQCRKTYTKVTFLVRLGVKKEFAWLLALSGKGKWRLSHTPQIQQAMNNKWFEKQGLYCLSTAMLAGKR